MLYVCGNPCVLHVNHNARGICKDILPIGYGTVGIHDDADIAVRFPDANPRDLRHVMRTIAERCLRMSCGADDSKKSDEQKAHQ